MLAALAGAGCGALGFALANLAQARVSLLWGCAEALRCLRTAVCVRQDLLPEALENLPAEGASQAPWARCFGELGRLLRQTPGAALCDVWRQAWADASGLAPLREADALLLLPLWQRLGQGGVADQQALLDGVTQDVRARHSALDATLANTRRLCRALGGIGGLCLFLLLL
jgi:stage III sporulation protein AB